MPEIDRLGRTVPALDDPANANQAFKDFSESLIAPVPVASATEAAQLAATATTWPLLTMEGPKLFVQEDAQATRTQIAGQRASVIAYIAATGIAPSTARYITVQSITRSTPGWQITSSGTGLIVPESGLYVFQAELKATMATNASTPTANTGTAQLQFYAAEHWFRNVFVDSGRFHVTALWNMQAGETIALNFRHSGSAAINVYGSLTAVQLA